MYAAVRQMSKVLDAGCKLGPSVVEFLFHSTQELLDVSEPIRYASFLDVFDVRYL